MPLFGKQSARRKEIRRTKAERRGVWLSRFVEPARLRQLLLVLSAALGAALVINLGHGAFPLRAGQTVPRAIASRVEFRVEDQGRTSVMRARARAASPNYYVLDNSLLSEINGRLTSLVRLAREHAEDVARLREEAGRNRLVLSDEAAQALIQLTESPDQPAFSESIRKALDRLAATPLVEPHADAAAEAALNAVLVDAERHEQRTLAVARLLFTSNRETVEQIAGEVAGEFSPPLRDSLRASILSLLREESAGGIKPVYRFDNARTAAAAEAAEKSVPNQYVDYAREARLIDGGEISPQELRLLEEEHHAYLATLFDPRNAASLAGYRLAMLGRSILAFCIVLALGGYIAFYREETFHQPLRPFITATMLVALLAAARLTYVYTSVPDVCVGYVAFAAALLAIIYPSGSIYAVCGLFSLLTTLATEQGTHYFITQFAVSMTLLLGLRDIRYRGIIVGVGALAAIVALITTVLSGLIDGQTLYFAFWRQGLWAAVATLGAAFLVDGILPGIERAFGVSTSMTLLEWCDASRPLLRQMAAEAPGTYNHSLMVGTLAEAAAESVGASGLLARTGAYYHDIGKINKPEYFVENQIVNGGSRHDRLSPAMSLLIIIGHVKDGVEMAREYRLPKVLHAFIAEHHGTTLVEYFYHVASRARKPSDPEVAETEFRYPGPKPQSRETAILMICDGVEGAVRAMSEPTPARIEDTVKRIVQKRLLDGQFDECGLSFKDLDAITRSVIKSLNSIYHARIAYPTAAEDDELEHTPEPTKQETRSAS